MATVLELTPAQVLTRLKSMLTKLLQQQTALLQAGGKISPDSRAYVAALRQVIAEREQPPLPLALPPVTPAPAPSATTRSAGPHSTTL